MNGWVYLHCFTKGDRALVLFRVTSCAYYQLINARPISRHFQTKLCVFRIHVIIVRFRMLVGAKFIVRKRDRVVGKLRLSANVFSFLHIEKRRSSKKKQFRQGTTLKKLSVAMWMQIACVHERLIINMRRVER